MKRGPKVGITLEDLPNNWQEFILNGTGEEGWRIKETLAFIAKAMGTRGFTYKVHARLCKDHEEYRDVMDEGRMLSEAWWLSQGRENLKTRDFNNTMYIFTMKSSFGYSDRPDIDPGKGAPFGDESKRQETLAKWKTKDVPQLAN